MKTRVIGLTGGIGSGKSTVARMFADLGVPIIDADVIARELVEPGNEATDAIIARFGSDIHSEGRLNRAKLREIIFSHPEQKLWLEALLHPAIHQRILAQIGAIDAPYCIAVIPLLAESFEKYRDVLDEILVVETPRERQITHTMARDKSSREAVEKILDAQIDPQERLKIATKVVQNEGSLADLKEKIGKLHQDILSRTSSSA